MTYDEESAAETVRRMFEASRGISQGQSVPDWAKQARKMDQFATDWGFDPAETVVVVKAARNSGKAAAMEEAARRSGRSFRWFTQDDVRDAAARRAQKINEDKRRAAEEAIRRRWDEALNAYEAAGYGGTYDRSYRGFAHPFHGYDPALERWRRRPLHPDEPTFRVMASAEGETLELHPSQWRRM